MKKYLLIATVALGLALTACSGSGKKVENAAAAAVDSVKTEVTAVADSVSVNANDVLGQYETLVNKVIELKAKGTAASVVDLSKLKDEGAALSDQLQKVASTLTTEQQQKLQDLMKKLSVAFAPAQGAK